MNLTKNLAEGTYRDYRLSLNRKLAIDYTDTLDVTGVMTTKGTTILSSKHNAFMLQRYTAENHLEGFLGQNKVYLT